jgi:uncharacterized protein
MKGIPSHWNIYFAAANTDDTVAKATAAGGSVMVPPQDIPNVGRFAFLQDPQGVMFGILQAAPR